MQSLLPPLLSSCPCCQPASSSCPVICLPAPHIPLRALSWDPPHPGCKLHTCLSADPPCPLTALLRASVLPPQLPLLFPFFSGALLVFLHPRSRQPPSAQPVAPSDLLRVVVPLFLCLSSLVSPPPAQVLPVPGCHPRGPCPGMCSRPLSPVQLPSLVLFLPCCFLLQMVLSLLLATHQLHPHHLSKSFAYSLLITFPSSLQKLPVPRAGSCFRVSLTAVMRILFPQVAFGVPVITPFSLGIPQALFPWGLAFTSLGPPRFSLRVLGQPSGPLPSKAKMPFQPTPGTQHNLLLGSLPRLASLPWPFSLPCHADRGVCLPLPSWICHFSQHPSPCFAAFQFLCSRPLCLTVPLNQDCPSMSILVSCLLHIFKSPHMLLPSPFRLTSHGSSPCRRFAH